MRRAAMRCWLAIGGLPTKVAGFILMTFHSMSSTFQPSECRPSRPPYRPQRHARICDERLRSRGTGAAVLQECRVVGNLVVEIEPANAWRPLGFAPPPLRCYAVANPP